MSIFDYFEHVQIINLPQRTDRRRDMLRVLRAVGAVPAPGRIEFFAAHRPTPAEAQGWPSMGARGCFASHLSVLRRARDAEWPRVLVMEDDLSLDVRFVDEGQRIVRMLEAEPWDLAYFAYNADPNHPIPGGDEVSLVPYLHRVVTTSFYAVDKRLYTPLIEFLEAVEARPPGDPNGGPMHVDGAYWFFRRSRRSVRALVATPELGWQRSSASDITPRLVDQVPGVRYVVGELRRLKRMFASRASRAQRGSGINVRVPTDATGNP